jgi:ABC-type nitrate/sulfonate/bicarbonate transport system substrate-binding protein
MPFLHQIVFVQPAIVVAAQATKAFEHRSLDLKTTYTKSSIQQRDGLLSGAYDLAITAMDNTISWSRDSGKDFRVLAQIERKTRLEIVGRGEFRRLEDLRGARLGVDAPDSGFVLVLRGALEAAGVRPDEYSLVPCGGVKARLEALLAGTADAALLGPPMTSIASGAGLHLMSSIEGVFPDYPGLGLVIRHDRLEELRSELAAYVAALSESLAWMRAHPVELGEALVGARFPQDSINDVLQTRPDSLRPDLPGIRRILDFRRRYDPRFDQNTVPEDLLDESLLAV